MDEDIQFVVEQTGVLEPVAIKAYVLMKEDLVDATFLCILYKNTNGMGVPSIVQRSWSCHFVKGLTELYKEFEDNHVLC